ncbi:MAG: heparinase II/III family protein [Alphaproteobacteria bacterium]|nr:heparinase II/III family protein [Alphaproteobacteria bacterium]
MANGYGQSLGERFGNWLYLLAWSTPLHGARLRGRFPLKLLAVPETALPADIQRGATLLDGHFTLLGRSLALADLDFASLKPDDPLYPYLQCFSWLPDLAVAGGRKGAAPVAEHIMRLWLDAHAQRVTENGWRQDLWGWRILNWTAHAPLILSSPDLIYRSAVLNALARGARHLDRTASHATPGLPRIVAQCGVLAAGLLIAGGEARQRTARAGLAQALSGGMSDDGGILSRSPHAQLDLVRALVMIAQIYKARQLELPDMIERALVRSASALQAVMLGDGGLASWQGSAPVGGDLVRGVIAATGHPVRPLRRARHWGYHRLANGATVLVVDAAPPPSPRWTQCGCASTLAFELSDGAQRLVVNCGGAASGSALLLHDLAHGLRTTAAHSTLTMADTNSTAVLARGALGRGVVEVSVDRRESEGASVLEASHDGYAHSFGFLHQREINMSADGKTVSGQDRLRAASDKRAPKEAPFTLRFHLAPKTEVSLTADGAGALLRIHAGPLWQFRVTGGALGVDDSLWVDAEGKPHATQQLVVTGHAAGGAVVLWNFKRAG